MNKADLIERIAIDTQIPKVKAAAALNSFTDTIIRELKNGGAVTLLGFGIFSLLKREARNARNPQTGEMMKVNEKKVAKFKPGKDFSSAIAE